MPMGSMGLVYLPTWIRNGIGNIHIVDGRNAAPVDRQFIPLFTGFYTSQLVQDFFHQQ